MTQIEQRRVLAKPTENLEPTIMCSAPGRHCSARTRANNVEARALLRRAIELDPNYAAAYAALAETYHLATSMGWAESPYRTLARAEEMAIKALSLDESEVRAHVILGRIHLFHQRYERQRQRSTARSRSIPTMPMASPGAATY